MEILDSNGQRGTILGLLDRTIDVEDTSSIYFNVVDFNHSFSAGKNFFGFNGSNLLQKNSQIQIECLDSAGSSLFLTCARSTSIIGSDTASFIVSIYVFGGNSNGQGSITLVGTTSDGKSVRYTTNIIIDKSLLNTSKVYFNAAPTINIRPFSTNLLKQDASNLLTNTINLQGLFSGIAHSPLKDTNQNYNQNVDDTDYRISLISPTNINDPSCSFNAQMVGSNITLTPQLIQQPFSYNTINVNLSPTTYVIKNVLNSTTLQLDRPIYYTDANNNNILINVLTGSLTSSYQYTTYTETDTFITMSDGVKNIPLQKSFAEITYNNIKTFSGYIARHKIYRKSLSSPADYEIVADEPLNPNELLKDNITLNENYSNIGNFYNQSFLNRYWFTSSNSFYLNQSSNNVLNSAEIIPLTNYQSLDGSGYIIVKNNSTPTNRDAVYVPFNIDQFNSHTGSAYDFNFLKLSKDVLYEISADVILKKDLGNTDAKLGFYFTSSVAEINQEPSLDILHGIKLGEISCGDPNINILYPSSSYSFLYTPNNDLYGTLTLVPYHAGAVLSNISIKPYGDVAFSPDILTTRIPFPINVPNETFEIKAELLDVNSNVVYSDLKTIKTFDISGSTLSTAQSTLITQKLQSITQAGGNFLQTITQINNNTAYQIAGDTSFTNNVSVGGTILFTGLTNVQSPYMVGYNNLTGKMAYQAFVSSSYDDKYIYFDDPLGVKNEVGTIAIKSVKRSIFVKSGGNIIIDY